MGFWAAKIRVQDVLDRAAGRGKSEIRENLFPWNRVRATDEAEFG
jgi:hypothetical protein